MFAIVLPDKTRARKFFEHVLLGRDFLSFRIVLVCDDARVRIRRFLDLDDVRVRIRRVLDLDDVRIRPLPDCSVFSFLWFEAPKFWPVLCHLVDVESDRLVEAATK